MQREEFFKEIESIVNVIDENEVFLIIGHVDPDGDCIGSMSAVAFYLNSLGKDVRCFVPGGVKKSLLRLPGAEFFVDDEGIEGFEPSVVFSLDAPTIARTADIVKRNDHRIVINIDHHPSNEFYGDINLVDASASATAVIIFRILSTVSSGVITPEMANCLYLGILLDTGGFRFQNTNAEALHTAGELIELGADAAGLARDYLYVKKLSTLKVLARALESLEVYAEGRIALMTITKEMVSESGSSMEDTEGFVDYASSVDEVLLSALFREVNDSETRVSLRSRNGYDVAVFAGKYGGGGHRTAAGLTIYACIEEAKALILDGFLEMLERGVTAD